VLPGATAIITNLATKQSREAVTNDAGVYTFVFVPPGDYSVNIDLAGFKRFVRDNVRVNLGSAVVIDALLELGRLEETITVAGDSPQLQLTTSSLGTVVESELLNGVPQKMGTGAEFKTAKSPSSNPSAAFGGKCKTARSSSSKPEGVGGWSHAAISPR
jgi:hypothetical protein